MPKKTLYAISLCAALSVITMLFFSACSHFQVYDCNRRCISTVASSKFINSVRPYRGDAESHYLLACYFQKRTKHNLALEEFRTAIKIDPTFVKAYNGMGISYDFLGDYGHAIESYKAALQVNPDLPYVHNNIGYAYLLQDSPDQAIENFQKAIALDKKKALYHNNLGLAFAENGQYERAFIEFKLAGNEVTAHHNMARIFYRKGLYDDSAVHFARSAAQNPVEKDENRYLKAADALAGILTESEANETNKIKHPDSKKISIRDSENFNNNLRTGFTVQCGSFEVHENARTREAVLKQKGYNAWIQKKEGQETYYAVNVGTFQTKSEAKVVALGIKESEGFGTLAVKTRFKNDIYSNVGPEIEAKKALSEVLSELYPDRVSSRIMFEVSNGNGVNRMAKKVGTYLNSTDFQLMYLTNADHYNYPQTIIYYVNGYIHEASKAAERLPGLQKIEMISHLNKKCAAIKVLIGKDLIAYMSSFDKS
ncbi:MAG: tetratricopeptide repeat protein [Dissulfuribacterales bacterium]